MCTEGCWKVDDQYSPENMLDIFIVTFWETIDNVLLQHIEEFDDNKMLYIVCWFIC